MPTQIAAGLQTSGQTGISRPATAAIRPCVAIAALAFSVLTSASGTLPYTPTTILLPGSHATLSHGINTSNVAFIFAPTDNGVSLLALDISATLKAGSINARTMTSSVPFADGGIKRAFAPSVADDGAITVFAGDCSSPTAAELWTYTPDMSASSSAEWTKHTATGSSTATDNQAAPYFLGGSLSFSSQLSPTVSPPVTYVYGGMCPWANTTGSSSQAAALYSRRMLKVSPPANGASNYGVAVTSTASQPPVAEAGFTFTQLTPAMSNRSGIVTQQGAFVVLGGHTQQAFVNMSTAAIWSLPEETWNFVNIGPPSSDKSPTELTVKEVSSSVDSRSGHTTVLSEDGNSLVLFGGWVGDTTQAASPQLAIIEVGSSLGEWRWSIPTAQPTGSGIYGHGAVLLPGNVMMVYGGIPISSSNKRRKRQAGASDNVGMFFNLTSQTWSNDYSNPNPSFSGSGGSGASGSNNADSSARSRVTGLGVGLGLGVPLLIAVIVAAVILFRRLQHKKEVQRESNIRGLAQDANHFLHESADDFDANDEMMERNWGGGGGLPPWNAATARAWYTGGQDPYQSGGRSLGYESLRGSTRTYPVPPAPTAPLGRPRNARGLYQPTPLHTNDYDFGPLRTLPTKIHPIYEDDETEHNGSLHGPDRGDIGIPAALMNIEAEEDPFMTPVGGTPTGTLAGGFFPSASSNPDSNTTGTSAGAKPLRGQEREVEAWVQDVDVADAVLTSRIRAHNTTTTTTAAMNAAATTPASPIVTTTLLSTTAPTVGPHSPSAMPAPLNIVRQGRTSPTRRRSAHGAGTWQAAESDDGRTGSNLSERTSSFVQGGPASDPARSDSVRSHFRNAYGGPTVTTVAAPGISAAATEARLDSSSSSERTYSTARTKPDFTTLQAQGPSLLHGETQGSRAEDEDGEEDEEEDFVHIPGSPSKSRPRRSWLGGLKRVFSGSGTASSPSSSSRGDSPTHEDVGSTDYESHLGGAGARRRLLRRKQGREAWEAMVEQDAGARGAADEHEWDIERAVEQRMVQVMFTVPKERLRVVNAEIEKEEEAILVDPEEDDHGGSSTSALPSNCAPPESSPHAGNLVRDHRETYAHGETDAVTDDSPSERTDSMNTTTFHTAEAIRLERRHTRVLDMVESIESRSRDESPVSTPQRSRTTLV